MVDEATRQNDLTILKSLPRMNESVVKKHHPFIINHINDFLNPEIHSYSFKHKLCYYFNNLKTFPKCKICGNDCKREIYLFPAGFNDANLYTCCKKCALIYGSKKARQTSMQKYGVTNVSFLKEIQEKKNKTCLEHYGVTNPSKSKEICDKRSDTILERFGTRNVNELSEIKQKIKNTCLEKYGVENAMYSPEIVEKIKKTNLEKFRSEWYLGTDDCLERTKKTVIEKYGVENINQTEKFRKRLSNLVKNRTFDEKLNTIISLYESKKEITNINVNCYRRMCNLQKYLKMTNDINLKTRIQTQLKRYQDKIIKEYGTCDITLDQIKKINNQIGKQKSENTCLKKYGVKNTTQTIQVIRKIRQKYKYIDKNNNIIYFDSGPEIALYIYLMDNNIDFEYHPNVKMIYEHCGKEHYYFPDFKIGNELWEIKGEQFFNKNDKMIDPYDSSRNDLMECKHQFMLQNNVKILRYKEYKKYIDYINNKYGRNFLNKFKNMKNENIQS